MTDFNTLAVPDGPRSHASHEARSGLRPSGFDRYCDPATGFIVSCSITSEETRQAFPWMPEYLWSAYPPEHGIYEMQTGASAEEAIAKVRAVHRSAAA